MCVLVVCVLMLESDRLDQKDMYKHNDKGAVLRQAIPCVLGCTVCITPRPVEALKRSFRIVHGPAAEGEHRLSSDSCPVMTACK